ncbi:hypothetical protein [Paraglaciecola sp. L3A3]|uniref:hypothetical protein n=1 Tax=Paraglaciecola sp. L3A3 TaxID=2686358 RepID=UPI00131DCCEE|nr:hypothetical protein [Paraglaciecola sp. L3A3]
MNTNKVKELVHYLDQFPQCSIAVSGGIDSMLLAYIAHQHSTTKVKMVHAYSPAVPVSALERVKAHTKQYGWDMLVIDAKEFDDKNYINNPVNRCYYCKSNLYIRIGEHTQGAIFSGTNMDDLGDVRPGLAAAVEQNVQHPYVEVGINKQQIYAIAKFYNLSQLHSLPGQPCLASRVETGIKIKSDDMLFIDHMEEKVRELLPSFKKIRCRISHQGIFIELDQLPEASISEKLSEQLRHFCAEQNRIFSGLKVYQKGSAFLNGITHG